MLTKRGYISLCISSVLHPLLNKKKETFPHTFTHVPPLIALSVQQNIEQGTRLSCPFFKSFFALEL